MSFDTTESLTLTGFDGTTVAVSQRSNGSARLTVKPGAGRATINVGLAEFDAKAIVLALSNIQPWRRPVMPGPKAERPTYKRDSEFTRPNTKTANRVEARVAAYETVDARVKPSFTKPGSQNRNK
jgi:hypothetical protein